MPPATALSARRRGIRCPVCAAGDHRSYIVTMKVDAFIVRCAWGHELATKELYQDSQQHTR